MLYIIK